jgi:hypothetical protein
MSVQRACQLAGPPRGPEEHERASCEVSARGSRAFLGGAAEVAQLLAAGRGLRPLEVERVLGEVLGGRPLRARTVGSVANVRSCFTSAKTFFACACFPSCCSRCTTDDVLVAERADLDVAQDAEDVLPEHAEEGASRGGGAAHGG